MIAITMGMKTNESGNTAKHVAWCHRKLAEIDDILAEREALRKRDPHLTHPWGGRSDEQLLQARDEYEREIEQSLADREDFAREWAEGEAAE